MRKISQELLAEKVSERRKEKNYTQEKLGVMTGMNRVTIGKVENREYLPSIRQLEKLAEVLQFSIEEVMEETGPLYYSAFRGSSMNKEEQDGVNHLFEMMMAARQQIVIEKAYHHD